MALTIKEIRDKLVELGCNHEKIVNMSKKQARELLESMEATKSALKEATADGESIVEEMNMGLPEHVQKEIANAEKLELVAEQLPLTEQNKEVVIPKMFSTEWTSYVLSLMTEKEKVGEYPKADGLRRIANIVFGPITTITNIIAVPSKENDRAVAVCSIQYVASDGRLVTVQGAADCNRGNTPYEYHNHAVSTAETRAEGKALKKALGLTGIYTIEELANGDTVEEPNDDEVTIQTGMLTGLMAKCNQMGVDISKILAILEIDVVSPKDMTKKDAKLVIAKLNEYQNTEIPENIKK